MPSPPPAGVDSIETIAGEGVENREKGSFPAEICSQMNAFRLESFFARKPEIGFKLRALGWNPFMMAQELNDVIPNEVFRRIEEALHILVWSEANVSLHSVHHTMTAIWEWAENTPQNVIMNTAYHVESYYWNSQANDPAASVRLAKAMDFERYCGQTEPDESNLHVLKITKVSLNFLENETPIFTYGPREESERLDMANQMNELGWERKDLYFLLSLEGQTDLYGSSITCIQLTSLIKLVVRNGVEGVVIRRMAELFKQYRSAGMIFYHFQMAQKAGRFDTDFFLNHELNY